MKYHNSLALGTFLAIGAISTAQANLINNGDFETVGNGFSSNGSGTNVDLDNLPSGKWSVYETIPGWSTESGPGIEIQYSTIFGDHTTGSGRYVELDSHKGTDTNTIMVQMLTGLTSGNDYELSLWYRPRTNNGNDDNGINILWSDTLPFAEPADIIASLSSTRNQQNDWMNFTYSLTASSDTMYLGFGAFGADNSLGGFIDDISLLSTNDPGISVPEPAPLALLGFGLGIIALRKKR